MTTIALLGSTGSIGQQTLAVATAHPHRVRVGAIAARNTDRLAQQAHHFGIPLVGIANSQGAGQGDSTGAFPTGTRILHGPGALVELATHPSVDIVVVATVGRAGLEATLAAARAGKRIAIANKEVLVMAGSIVTREARAHGATLLPIDSEHSALWQCLIGEQPNSVDALLLTASGGALRDRDPATWGGITPDEALRHPTWVMGPKVTIDSATLMNKGLEAIEARWLFDVPLERIHVVMHPTSTVHSLVRFRDGTLKAQLGIPDMKTPIQFALSYPERWPVSGPQLDITTAPSLQFSRPKEGHYPCLELALDAGRRGGTYPAALCGADEVAVELFLQGQIRFTDIARLVESVLERHTPGDQDDLRAIEEADAWARRECAQRAEALGGAGLA